MDTQRGRGETETETESLFDYENENECCIMWFAPRVRKTLALLVQPE